MSRDRIDQPSDQPGHDADPPDLLSTVPLGPTLAGILRLLLPADRRDEFLGDLIEEANLRRRTCTRAELGWWLWNQALASAPTLVSWRVRRLVFAPRAGTLLLASRAGRRGWTLSLAVSVSAHALVLIGAVALVLSRVEEMEPRFAIDLSAAMLPDPPSDEPGEQKLDDPFTGVLQQVRARRLRTSRRPLAPARPLAPGPADAPATDAQPPAVSAPAPAAAAGPTANSATGLHAAVGPLDRGRSGAEPRLRLPPRVGEKRCLSCPIPQLPHPYARLGIGQEMLVRTCVGIRGDVTSVEVLRGFDPIVDERVKETIRRWKLAPYSLDGHPVPFCYPTRFLFTTH
jgi:hypothetical protein